MFGKQAHIHSRATAIAVALAAFIALSVPAGAVTAHAAPGQAGASKAARCCGTWSIVPSPNGTTFPNSRLLGVSALTAGHAWAVGLNFVVGDHAQTLIEAAHGTAWSIVPSPNPPNTFQSILNGVTAISSKDVWAVGSNAFFPVGTTLQTNTLIEHWNGRQWTIVSSPNVGSFENTLSSVAAVSMNDVWTVGSSVATADGPRLSLIERWNGTAWSIVTGADLPGVTDSALASVTAVPGTGQAWAVGYALSGPRPAFEHALIEHWNGSTWQTVPSAAPAGALGSKLGGVVALSATDAWAVGDYTASDHTVQPLIERWNGAVWQVVLSPRPDFADRGSLLHIAAAGPRDVRVVGAFFAPDAGTGQPMVEQWDGTQWHLVPVPAPSQAASSFLDGIAADRAGKYWAVGSYVDSGPILTFRTLTERSGKRA